MEVFQAISGPGTEYSAVRAIDVTTGQVRWEYKVGAPSMAGITSTALASCFYELSGRRIQRADAATGRNGSTNTGANIYGAAPPNAG